MIKKRVFLYFVILAFPMGLGAGAGSWLKLPTIAAPILFISPREASVETVSPAPPAPEQASQPASPTLPDFSVIHPLVIGSFCLLFCTGILLAADKSDSH